VGPHPALKGEPMKNGIEDENFLEVMQSLRTVMEADAVMVHLTGTVLQVIEQHMRSYASMLVAVSEGISTLADSVAERKKELAVADVKSAAVTQIRDEKTLN
jgi:hypothetical protein